MVHIGGYICWNCIFCTNFSFRPELTTFLNISDSPRFSIIFCSIFSPFFHTVPSTLVSLLDFLLAQGCNHWKKLLTSADTDLWFTPVSNRALNSKRFSWHALLIWRNFIPGFGADLLIHTEKGSESWMARLPIGSWTWNGNVPRQW